MPPKAFETVCQQLADHDLADGGRTARAGAVW
ncbi:hypothetical protein QJS66_02945 [Kocuria rhizophila]|nr:hypothetical protein QJS66_02945 [Kocuria rhizophila]